MPTDEEMKVTATDEASYRLEHPGVLRVYDARFDSFRDATQIDLDALMAVGQAYGRVSQFWAKNHQELGQRLNWPGFQVVQATVPTEE